MKITPKQYALLLLDLEKEGVEKVSKIVLRNKDTKKMAMIEQAYLNLKSKQAGVIDAEVVTTQELPEEQLEIIKEKLSVRYNTDKKNIKISTLIDKDLRGGIVIRAANEVIDASVRSRINQIKKSLL